MEYDEEGRIGVKLLKARLRFDDYDFYMCGPAGFMQSVYDGLRDLQVADSRIHAEAFGPSGLTRRQDATLHAPARMVATDPTRVAFVRSAKEARWTPQAGTLLDLAESRGLAPAFSCRRGSCGTCSAKILQARSRTIVRPPSTFSRGRR
jgi:ferredoxin-NADP reductase